MYALSLLIAIKQRQKRICTGLGNNDGKCCLLVHFVFRTAATAHEIHKPASFTRVRLIRANSSQIVPDFTVFMALSASFVMFLTANLLVANIAEELATLLILASK